MMAGKFLSIDEAAEHLGVSPERVRQLVDKRLISALRDTAGPKFRVEDLDRYLADASAEAADSASQAVVSPAGAAEPGSSAGGDSGLSLDGLELDLSDSAEASVVIHEPEADQPHPEVPAQPTADGDDALAVGSGISLSDLDLASGLSLAGDAPAEAASAAASDEASLVLDEDSGGAGTSGDESPAADLQPAVDGPSGDNRSNDDSLVIGDEPEPAALGQSQPRPQTEDEVSLVLGDDLEDSPAEGPQTLVGADDSLVIGDDEPAASPAEGLADAPSLVAGDDIELSGVEMSLAGDLSGIELDDPDTGGSASQPANGAEQSLVVGDSLGGDLDLESLVAGSGMAGEEPGDEISVAGSDGAEGSGILVDSGSGADDVGSQLSGGSGVIMEGGLSLEGDEVKAWDVDLGEFMNDVEEDADAPTMLGGGGEFDLEANATAEDPSQSADLASESQVGGDSSFFDKSQGPADSSFFGQSVGLEGGGLGDATPLSEMTSSSAYGVGLETKFTNWQVAGLFCCSVLLLVGGLLTFDLVRTIGSPADTPLANPLAGSLADLLGWRQ